MSTLNEMVDEIKSNLQGYTLRQDRISYVANPAGSNYYQLCHYYWLRL
jgi:hypothetical protein